MLKYIKKIFSLLFPEIRKPKIGEIWRSTNWDRSGNPFKDDSQHFDKKIINVKDEWVQYKNLNGTEEDKDLIKNIQEKPIWIFLQDSYFLSDYNEVEMKDNSFKNIKPGQEMMICNKCGGKLNQGDRLICQDCANEIENEWDVFLKTVENPNLDRRERLEYYKENPPIKILCRLLYNENGNIKLFEFLEFHCELFDEFESLGIIDLEDRKK